MKTLLIIFLTLFLPLQTLSQNGNTKVDVSNLDIVLLNKLLNKKIYNHNKVKNFGEVTSVSNTDTIALSVGEVRVTKMLKNSKLSHTLPNIYDEMKGSNKTTEVGENVIYSSKLMGKTFTYNDLVKDIYKGFMNSTDHKMLIEASYNEKGSEVFISTFIKFKKNGSFYGSMIFSM
jgi:uncharacterized protein YkwD